MLGARYTLRAEVPGASGKGRVTSRAEVPGASGKGRVTRSEQRVEGVKTMSSLTSQPDEMG